MNTRSLVSLVVCAAIVVVSTPAFSAARAAAKAPAAKAEEKEEEEEEEGKDQKAAGGELPSDPTGKLYEKFEMSRGFFISSDVGMVWAFGGYDPGRSSSNTQAYVGLNIGYDFTSWFSWQIHAGRGFAASSPRSPNQVTRIRDFGWTNVLTGPLAWIRIWERLAIEVKLLGGIAILDPVPLEVAVDGVAVSVVAGSIGGGVGLKYMTLLTDFTIGFEATFLYMIVPGAGGIPALNIAPLVVRYTF
ncbi:MAG: adventurous gliding motility protein CglE [Deltaproteobacteria bacterium]|nr:adventurous gliding motility protein CglE [Deltaproteobacteria bacterium]